MKLTRLDTHDKIVAAIDTTGAPFTFFGSPYMLNAFFNNKGFELWSVEFQNETYIFVRKVEREYVNNELRLLFKIFPDELIAELKQEFDPPFIAYNELAEDPHQENQIEDIEVVVDIEKYVALEHKSTRKHYKQAVRDNVGIDIREFKDIPNEDLQEFWKTWMKQREDRPFAADRTHNDAHFFELYSSDMYFGTAAYVNGALVAYSIGVPFDEKRCISTFNKCLRGYTNLGLQISYTKAVLAKERGFTAMSLGGINNDFKKQFLTISTPTTFYGVELWRRQGFKTRTPHGYTGALFI